MEANAEKVLGFVVHDGLTAAFIETRCTLFGADRVLLAGDGQRLSEELAGVGYHVTVIASVQDAPGVIFTDAPKA